jgi:integrase
MPKQSKKPQKRQNGAGSFRVRGNSVEFRWAGKSKTEPVNGRTQDQLIARLSELRGLPVEHNNRMMFNDLADAWYKDLGEHVRAVGPDADDINEREHRHIERSTYDGYDDTLTLVKKACEGKQVCEITAAYIVNTMYTLKKKDGKGYRIGTYEKIKAMLNQVFTFAVLSNIITAAENPMPSVPRLKESVRMKSSRSSYTLADITKLYMALPNDIWGHMIRLDLMLGGRGQEIRALRDTDISADGSRIEISKAIKRADGGEYEGDTKTPQSDRIVKVPLVARPSAVFLRNHAVNGYVFYNPQSKKPYSYKGYLDNYNRAIKETGVKRLVPHDMRASLITLARNYADVPDKVLQGITGHADLKTMHEYDRPQDAEQEAASNAISGVLQSALNEAIAKQKRAQTEAKRRQCTLLSAQTVPKQEG